MRETRAVITGLGVVSPAGRGNEEYFGNLLKGKSILREITRFDASRYPARHAGLVDNLDSGGLFSKRLIKKLDRFSEMALVATDDALKDAGLDIDAEDKDRVGIILGNALGGWSFAEVELRDLYQTGVREVSPYQATAWFPAAPQGQVSIHYGIKGFAKTIISDIASSHLAVSYAARAVVAGKADVVVAGGTEAPISPYALLCCNSSGELSTAGKYRPFDRRRDGYVIGEGAGILIVEGYERAKARGAKIYAEIKGFGHTSDGADPVNPDVSGDGLARAMRAALSESGSTARDIDYLMPSGNGGRLYDASESNALTGVFGDSLNDVMAGVPKALYGNLLGASGALDMVTACLAMERGQAPTYTGCNEPEDNCRWAEGSGGKVNKEIGRVMINSTGRGGVNTCVVLAKP